MAEGTAGQMTEEERQRRIDEAKRKAEEARRARETGGAGAQAIAIAPPKPAPAPPTTVPRPSVAAAPKPGAAPAAPQPPPRLVPTALKEWAVVVKALEEGKQIILFRKGGIAEADFRIKTDEFVLFPTYEHQEEKYLKPAHKPMLQLVGTASNDPNRITVTSWARLEEVIPVRNLDKLVQLEDYHIFTRAYAEERHSYKPNKPTNVLFVRTYLLPESMTVELTPEQAGCVSWVDIDVKVPWQGSRPVLSDEEFRKRHKEVRTIIS